MALLPLMKLRGAGLHVGIVTARFNAPICEKLLTGAKKALADMGVDVNDIAEVTVPGALEIPFALQAFGATEHFDALVASGCIIKGETYHFEIVCNESAAGISRVGLDHDVAIGNGVLTSYTEVQAVARAEQKGFEAAQAAVEMALLQEWTHANFGEA